MMVMYYIYVTNIPVLIIAAEWHPIDTLRTAAGSSPLYPTQAYRRLSEQPFHIHIIFTVRQIIEKLPSVCM